MIITIVTDDGASKTITLQHACDHQELCTQAATLCTYVAGFSDLAAKRVSVQCAPEKKRMRALLKAIELMGLA